MRGFPAKTRLHTGLFLALALSAGLSACSTIDSMFGDEGEDISAADAAAPTAGSAAVADLNAPAPTASAFPSAGTAAPLAGPAPTAGAFGPTITPVTISQGPDTGTAVNKTIQTIRGQIAGLNQKLGTESARLAELRGSGAASASAYQQAKAYITTRLQVGTTKGNPELVAQWNSAQNALDAITANINQLNALGTELSNDSSSAHFALDQIGATFNVSGAVDEDHRQLSLLEDETSQTIVLLDRLLKDVSDDVQRQTAYAGNERASLTVLAGSIKNGELYGGTPGITAQAATGGVQLATAGQPLVVIRFDHPDVDYQQILYAALNQALQSRPNAGFQVVAVAPTRGNAASVQIAQTNARRYAQQVMRSMTDMGVPASRLGVASATDAGVSNSEVRVFVR
jgi:hypothetical protein